MKFVDMLCGSEVCAKLGKKADFVHQSLASGQFYAWCADCHKKNLYKGVSKCDYNKSGGKCHVVKRDVI